MGLAFDTLAYAKKLKSAGFTEEQAETQVEALAQIVDDKLATKKDIMLIHRDIEELRIEFKRDLAEMESRLIIKMGSMLVVTIGILATLMKIL